MRQATAMVLPVKERAELAMLFNSGLTGVRLALGARIVLLAAAGMQNKDIAVELGVRRGRISLWREHFTQRCLSRIERNLPRVHQRSKFQTWLEKPPRFNMHFMSKSASWLNI